MLLWSQILTFLFGEQRMHPQPSRHGSDDQCVVQHPVYAILGLSPTNACVHVQVCGSNDSMTQEVSRCCTRGESEKSTVCRWQSMQAKALKPRTVVTTSPKQGYQWPHKKTNVLQIFFLKKVHPHFLRMHPIINVSESQKYYICWSYFPTREPPVKFNNSD